MGLFLQPFISFIPGERISIPKKIECLSVIWQESLTPGCLQQSEPKKDRANQFS